MVDRLEIDRLLDRVELTPPIQSADMTILYNTIGKQPGLEVYHTLGEVHVVIYRGGEVWYKRSIPVVASREQNPLPQR